MRIGLVCPYSLDIPGGVQNHVKDLAETLIALGHHVSVLAPSEEERGLPAYVVAAGRAVPVPYNGSVARVTFGPVAAARVRRWLRDGRFDVIHLHEPAAPSLSLLTLWAAEGPVVATFHTSQVRSRAMSASSAILRPSLEKITARIAVSEYARDTLVQHIGGEPVVIANGLYVDRYASARPRSDWAGETATVAYVGRLDEPRKGFPVMLRALPLIVRACPGARLLVVGGGDIDKAAESMPPGLREHVTFLGRASDEEKAAALKTADLYVAPNTGGESFGIVLVEAMASGATVLASDLPAFRRVLGGSQFGALFPVGDAKALAAEAVGLLSDPTRRHELDARATTEVRRYDWSTIAEQIVAVYETVAGEVVRR